MPSGPAHFSFQLPWLKYYMPNRCTVFIPYQLLAVLSSGIVFNWKLFATRLLKLSSLAHWTTKLPVSLVQEESLLSPGNRTWVFSAMDSWQLVMVFSMSDIPFFILLSQQNWPAPLTYPLPLLPILRFGKGDFLCESHASCHLINLLLFAGLKRTLGFPIVWKLQMRIYNLRLVSGLWFLMTTLRHQVFLQTRTLVTEVSSMYLLWHVNWKISTFDNKRAR